jgi:hypothetical protein
MRIAILIVLLPLVFARNASAQSTDASVLSWMTGCWLAQQGSGEVEEQWSKAKGGTLIGTSRTVRGERTTAFEFLMIRPGGDGLVYAAHPSGQAPTDFRITDATATLLRAEKPDHDFPQKIEYIVVAPDAVTAHVYGGVDDAEPAFSLNYARTNCE